MTAPPVTCAGVVEPPSLFGADRCLVVGVLNVTPDSFSDGGAFRPPARAIEHGLRLAEQGADLVDIGGESTRPGAARIPEQQELDRVLPIVEALVARGVRTSIDTMRSDVARAAAAAGAILVNDVSGGRADERMYATVADLGVPYVLTHWRAHSAQMHEHAWYCDVVAEVCTDLITRATVARETGVRTIAVDPGLGFAKNGEHNWALLRGLDTLVATRMPVLVGASRKRFLGELLANDDGAPRPITGREAATTAVTALAAHHGAWAVRVHDVGAAADAVLVARQWWT